MWGSFSTPIISGRARICCGISSAPGRLIYGVHINDMPAVPGPGIDRRLLGQGVIPLHEILSAIEATGYRGYYDVEIMSEQVWAMDPHEVLDALKAGFQRIWE